MTIRKTFTSAHTKAARRLVIGSIMAGLTGCGMIGSVIGVDKVDYKSAKKAQPLDVPPDLTQLQKDNRYGVPDNARGVATASGYEQQKGSAPAANAGEPIGAANTPVLRVERAGTQRWLVVRQTPEQLWPQLKEFWLESGFAIVNESSATGIMETDWNENRTKIPQDMIRNTIGKLFDGMYSTGERDKYRTRLERTADGATEIYISHRGIQEVLTGAQKETSQWAARPNDPGLEAQFLAKLMTRLGSDGKDGKDAKTAVAQAIVQPLHAKLVTGTGTNYVEVDEGFDRAWRRTGLALDRVGFTVEDRDRVQGLYFVRYIDPDAVKTEGFFTRLMNLGSNPDKAKEAQRYRVQVKAAGALASQLTVQNHDGKPESSATGDKILALLNDQLK